MERRKRKKLEREVTQKIEKAKYNRIQMSEREQSAEVFEEGEKGGKNGRQLQDSEWEMR